MSLNLTCATVSLDHLLEEYPELARRGLIGPRFAAPWGRRPAGTAGEEEKKDLSRREQAPDAYGCPAASGPLGTAPPL